MGQVVLEAAGADGGEVDRGGGGDAGEGHGVAADAGAEVEDLFCAGGGEAVGFVGGDAGVGGLFEGFGDAPGVGEVGEFEAGFFLELAEGEGGVDDFGGVFFAEGGDFGDGGGGVFGEHFGDVGAKGLARAGVEEFEGVEGDGGIGGNISGRGG